MTEKESTQAEKWVESLKQRSAHITGVEEYDTLIKIINTLDIDYPNQLFRLVDSDSGTQIGMRRVFGDRSYCDTLLENASIGKIGHGVLSEGLLGTAQNGRIILH